MRKNSIFKYSNVSFKTVESIYVIENQQILVIKGLTNN